MSRAVPPHPFYRYTSRRFPIRTLKLAAAYLAFGGVLFEPPLRATADACAAGRARTAIKYNVATGRDATALFHTEVGGWRDMATGPR